MSRNMYNPEEQARYEQEILNSLPDLDKVQKEADNRPLVIHETDRPLPVNVRAKKVTIIRDFNGEVITRDYSKDSEKNTRALREQVAKKVDESVKKFQDDLQFE